jgi:hypothetical protein
MRTNRASKTLADELLNILRTNGVRSGVITHSTRHNVLTFTVGEQRHRVSFSSSPSDFRAPLNAKADVRRILRAAGVIQPKDSKNARN